MCLKTESVDKPTDPRAGQSEAAMRSFDVGGVTGPSIEHFIEDKIDDLLNQIQRLQRLRHTVRQGYLPAEVTEFMKEAVVRL